MHGVGVDWVGVFGSGVVRVGLPSYAFERQRFWLGVGGGGDLGAVGLAGMGHPFLGAGVLLGGGQGWLFTGRLSVGTHPWLVDHSVFGVVLVPGAALVEMALAAGVVAGVEGLEELVLEAPLVVADGAAVQLQLLVDVADEDGRCRFGIYSRVESVAAEGGGGAEWTRHGSGVLTADLSGGVLAGGGGGEGFAELVSGSWPPVGAVAVDGDGLYDRLAGVGFQYGPAFQGVRALWRRGDEVFAEVALGSGQLGEVMGFGLHPALFDAALHAAVEVVGGELSAGRVPLPFAWNGVSLAATGAASLRVRIRAGGAGGLQVYAVDEGGVPVLRVDGLTTRLVDAAQLEVSSGSQWLHQVRWVPVGVPDSGGAAGHSVAWIGPWTGVASACGVGG